MESNSLQSEEESILPQSFSMLDLSNTNQDTSRDVETTREVLADVTPRQSRRKQTFPTRRGANLNREIRRLQRTTSFMIPRMCFARLVREILFEETNPNWRMSTAALEALQTATEMYITQRLEDAFLLTLHRGRVTLDLRDLRLVNFMLNRHGELFQNIKMKAEFDNMVNPKLMSTLPYNQYGWKLVQLSIRWSN